jgi:hypothetical protein
MMPRTLNSKGVSTAVATTAIILVLVMSLTWMAYTVVLNARQQAQAAERAETIALKAKELIRVYVWLDPAQQTNGQYLNLTRISFVGSWSGETTINGLLVVYRDGSSRMLGLNIRLGAGEEKTYLPSELGIPGLDNYDAFRRAVKYIQAHTSLGNDFVNLWGRPDKPAIYIVTTTNTGTTTTATTPPTTTTTTTSPPPTTTTTTTTTPPTTTTTTGPTTSTVTSTVTRTVTSTLTSTSTAYYSTRCTVTTWVGAQTTVTRTVTSTVTYWGTYTSTITHTTTVTSTSTSTTWVTSTVTSTATSVSTVWTTVTSTYWVTTTRTSTFTSTTTTTRWVTVTYDDQYIGPSLEPIDAALSEKPCWVRIMVVSGSGGPSQPSMPPSGQTSPEMLLAFIGLMFYGSYGRKVPVRRLVSMFFSPPGLAVLLVIAVFTVGPVMEAAAQTATTTVTTTVTSTSYVTSTATTTQTVCTATDTVTSTTTGTITVTSTVYVTTTTGPTTYVTSTVTVTSTAYTTRTSTYYTTTYTTRTITSTSTWTSTVTSTFTTIIWVTTTITSTSTKYTDTTTTRCLPWTCGTDCSCVWCCGC